MRYREKLNEERKQNATSASSDVASNEKHENDADISLV